MSDKRDKKLDSLIDNAANLGRGEIIDDERRAKERQPYNAPIKLVIFSSAGDRLPKITVQAKDISLGGMCVTSRQMIHPGTQGILRLVKSDGKMTRVGVRVRYCQYVGGMLHHTGLEFTALPNTMLMGNRFDL